MRQMRIVGVSLVLLFISSGISWAQLKFIERFPFPDTTTAKPWGGTKLPFGVLNCGIGVDPEGKVWLAPYQGTGVDSIAADTGGYRATRPIYVFKRDGTPASFSPIKVLTGPNELGTTVTDTLESRSNYGGGIDPSTGDFVAVWGNLSRKPGMLLWKVNYKTGAGVRRLLNPGGLTINSPASVAVDGAGEAFLTGVVGPLPGLVLNADFTTATQFSAGVPDIGRAIAVSSDGNDVYCPRFTGGVKTFIYHSANGSLGPYALADSIFQGASVEAIAVSPSTGYVWASADRRSGKDSTQFHRTWTPNMFYAYDPVGKAIVDSFSTAIDSHGNTLWDISGTGPLPRGIAFSPTGDTVYVAHFDVPTVPVVQRFIRMNPTSVQKADGVPNGFELKQNFPNPFNPSTEIRFSVVEPGKTTLIVYDMLGREVRGLVNGNLDPGSYKVTFNAGYLSSGTYVYVLTSGSSRLVKKMVLMK